MGNAAVSDELADARNDVQGVEAEISRARADLTDSVATGDLEKMLRARSAIEVTLPAKLDAAHQHVANLRLLAAETAQAIFRELDDVTAAVISGQQQRIQRLTGDLTGASTAAPAEPPMTIIGYTDANQYPAAEPRPVRSGSHVSVPRLVDGANPYAPQIAKTF